MDEWQRRIEVENQRLLTLQKGNGQAPQDDVDQMNANIIERNRLVEEKNLEKLSKRFRCHVCGVGSMKPARLTKYVPNTNEFASGSTEQDDGPNWNLPGDLERCTKCNKWTCQNDLYKGVCKTCAQKLPPAN